VFELKRKLCNKYKQRPIKLYSNLCVCVYVCDFNHPKSTQETHQTSASREGGKKNTQSKVNLDPIGVVREYMILGRTLSWEDNFNHVCLAHMSDLSVGQIYEHDESWLLI